MAVSRKGLLGLGVELHFPLPELVVGDPQLPSDFGKGIALFGDQFDRRHFQLMSSGTKQVLADLKRKAL